MALKFNIKHGDGPYNDSTSIQQGVFNSFRRGSNREMFCDFTVVVEGVEFPCHRFVLNACSGFFEALLRSDMKEQKERKASVHGFSSKTFKMILDTIYSGSNFLTQENMIEMWNAVHQLQIEFLISECEDFILKNVNSENCYPVYVYAELLQSAKVIQFISDYMVQNFFSFANSTNFVKLKYEILIHILKMKQISVCVDFQVEAVLKWCGIENDEKKQSQQHTRSNQNLIHLGKLLQALDLTKATKQCLANLLKNTSVQENKQAVAVVNAQAAASLCNNPADPFGSCYEERNYFAPNYAAFQFGAVTHGVCEHCQKRQFVLFH